MGLRKMVATDLGMAQTQAYLNRGFVVMASGSGSASYTMATDPNMMVTITDVLISGSGTFTISEGGETVLSVDVNGSLVFSPKAFLNLDLKNQVVFSLTGGSGQVKMNIIGFFVRK